MIVNSSSIPCYMRASVVRESSVANNSNAKGEIVDDLIFYDN